MQTEHDSDGTHVREQAPHETARNEMTDVHFWDSTWSGRPRMRFPSGIDVGTRNVLRVLRPRLRPGLRFIEIGCAPGKILAWVGREVGGAVAGLDFSPTGSSTSRWLCQGLGIQADIRCEEAIGSTFPAASFDLVFSNGLIEHFEDPIPIVREHLRLLAPGGTALILVPHYRGIYLAAQKRLDPENLAIHNLAIMDPTALQRLVPPAEGLATHAYLAGRFSPWLMSLKKKMGTVGTMAAWGLNMAGLLQPFDVATVCPLLVLEVRSPANRFATVRS